MRIGLTQMILDHNGIACDSLEHGWYNLLSGHSIFALPNTLHQDFDPVADTLDSVIITGGTLTSLKKDTELAIIEKMMQRGKPIVGVCTGALLIAEMLGATIQTIPNHNNIEHYVMYNGEAIKVNSHHGVGITNMNEKGEILCLSDTGEVEAFVHNNLAGVMWHPQRMTNPWIPPEIAFLLRI